MSTPMSTIEARLAELGVTLPDAPAPVAKAAGSALPDADAPAVPRHVAIVMDGNGRWARQRYMPRFFGHKAGVEVHGIS
mgnify:CR=1 FL=1